MTTLREFTDALKYLGRLNKSGFKMLLYFGAHDDFVDKQWKHFQDSPLYFLWTLSSDKLNTISIWLNLEASGRQLNIFTQEEEQ
jgi:hypothetical protein